MALKLSNRQIEVICSEIQKEAINLKKSLIENAIKKDFSKYLTAYKKTTGYKELLKMEEVSKLKDVEVYIGSDSKFWSGVYRSKLKNVEEHLEKMYQYSLGSKINIPSLSDLENKLVLSTIQDFDLEVFKAEILKEIKL